MTTSADSAALANARSSFSGTSSTTPMSIDVAIEPRQHPVQGVAVAVVDLAGGERRADRFQLVAGGKECDPQFPVDADFAHAERCDHADLGGVHALAGAEHHLAGLEILAREAPVGAGSFTSARCAMRTWPSSSLVRSCITTAVGARRHHAAGKDAHALPVATEPVHGLPANDVPTRRSTVSPSVFRSAKRTA